MFRFIGDEDARRLACETFKSKLEALPRYIEMLKSIEVGININSNERWDLTLIATADTMANVTAYSTHPLHVAAVDAVRDSIAERACVDFEAYV